MKLANFTAVPKDSMTTAVTSETGSPRKFSTR